MLRTIEEGLHAIDSKKSGPSVAVSYGVHGNERSPIEAGQRLFGLLESRGLELGRGRLLLIHANPRASAEDRRWSRGGVDLNRCFHPAVLERPSALYEEERAGRLVAALEDLGVETLVDFHCTVEPGRRFLMQHPPADDEAHRRVGALLRAEVLLTDPGLTFGGVSFDEWMSARARVGICYETGWIGDPGNTADSVLEEMVNLLVGLGLVAGEPRSYPSKEVLRLEGVLECEGEGFVWSEGVGENLQALDAGTVLGAYPGGRELVLERAASLVFPKKRPELVRSGRPLTYLAERVG